MCNTISEITRAKWTERLAQVMECLLCKCEVLNSNPNTLPKKVFKKSPKEKN
jgi:predicted house-cleaning noncanonical NTP pyrophosphatase (MazG superfamily)